MNTDSTPTWSAPVDPCQWDNWVASFAGATVFHSSKWQTVLVESYGLTQMTQALLIQQVPALLFPCLESDVAVRGRRASALPFSDRCPALASEIEHLPRLWDRLLKLGSQRNWKRLEFDEPRMVPANSPGTDFRRHSLPLRAAAKAWHSRDAGNHRRAAVKARAQGVTIRRSREKADLKTYYGLHCETRQRHGIPPQPWKFFESIHSHLISAGLGDVFLALNQGRHVAGGVFLHSFGQVTYKFGATNSEGQALNANHALLWDALEHYAINGHSLFDFGKSSASNEGLRRFKRGWGASDEPFRSFRFDLPNRRFQPGSDLSDGIHTKVFRLLPPFVNRMLGTRLYRYLA